MKLARLFIARVFLLFSFSVSSSVRGDEAADISHIRGTLDILNEYVQADQMQFLQGWKQAELQALQNVVPVEYQDRVLKSLVGRGLNDTFQWSDSDNIRAYLEQLTRAMFGVSAPSQTSVSSANSLLATSRNSYQQLVYIRQLLSAISNSVSSSTVPITNIVNVNSGADALAFNPWWATNSAFALVANNYSLAYPDDGQNLSGVLSFPQFMSKWSAKLSAPAGSGSLTPASALQLWGLGSFRQWGSSNQQGFTWFDWVSDVMRSNLVAQGHSVRTLDSILSASLNSGGSTNIVNVLVTNIVGGVTNILRADDILAANPWWWTNSNFSVDWFTTRDIIPNHTLQPYHVSFPEAFSYLASSVLPSNFRDLPISENWIDRYGVGGQNVLGFADSLTWFDWVAEMMKSNLVLTTASSATNIVDELYQAGYDTEVSITNTPLPDYEFPVEDVAGLKSTLQSGESSVNSFLDSIQKPGTGGDSEIVLIPEFTIGGIHVNEYRADLDSPIVPYCRRVLTFLYYVGVGVFMFQLAKSEYVYYATLGRHWGKY